MNRPVSSPTVSIYYLVSQHFHPTTTVSIITLLDYDEPGLSLHSKKRGRDKSQSNQRIRVTSVKSPSAIPLFRSLVSTEMAMAATAV